MSYIDAIKKIKEGATETDVIALLFPSTLVTARSSRGTGSQLEHNSYDVQSYQNKVEANAPFQWNVNQRGYVTTFSGQNNASALFLNDSNKLCVSYQKNFIAIDVFLDGIFDKGENLLICDVIDNLFLVALIENKSIYLFTFNVESSLTLNWMVQLQYNAEVETPEFIVNAPTKFVLLQFEVESNVIQVQPLPEVQFPPLGPFIKKRFGRIDSALAVSSDGEDQALLQRGITLGRARNLGLIDTTTSWAMVDENFYLGGKPFLYGLVQQVLRNKTSGRELKDLYNMFPRVRGWFTKTQFKLAVILVGKVPVPQSRCVIQYATGPRQPWNGGEPAEDPEHLPLFKYNFETACYVFDIDASSPNIPLFDFAITCTDDELVKHDKMFTRRQLAEINAMRAHIVPTEDQQEIAINLKRGFTSSQSFFPMNLYEVCNQHLVLVKRASSTFNAISDLNLVFRATVFEFHQDCITELIEYTATNNGNPDSTNSFSHSSSNADSSDASSSQPVEIKVDGTFYALDQLPPKSTNKESSYAVKGSLVAKNPKKSSPDSELFDSAITASSFNKFLKVSSLDDDLPSGFEFDSDTYVYLMEKGSNNSAKKIQVLVNGNKTKIKKDASPRLITIGSNVFILHPNNRSDEFFVTKVVTNAFWDQFVTWATKLPRPPAPPKKRQPTATFKTGDFIKYNSSQGVVLRGNPPIRIIYEKDNLSTHLKTLTSNDTLVKTKSGAFKSLYKGNHFFQSELECSSAALHLAFLHQRQSSTFEPVDSTELKTSVMDVYNEAQRVSGKSLIALDELKQAVDTLKPSIIMESGRTIQTSVYVFASELANFIGEVKTNENLIAFLYNTGTHWATAAYQDDQFYNLDTLLLDTSENTGVTSAQTKVASDFARRLPVPKDGPSFTNLYPAQELFGKILENVVGDSLQTTVAVVYTGNTPLSEFDHFYEGTVAIPRSQNPLWYFKGAYKKGQYVSVNFTNKKNKKRILKYLAYIWTAKYRPDKKDIEYRVVYSPPQLTSDAEKKTNENFNNEPLYHKLHQIEDANTLKSEEDRAALSKFKQIIRETEIPPS